jgi:hypothetical protein
MRNAFLPSTLMNPYFWCCERWAKKACPPRLCWRDLLRHCTRWVSLATNQCGSWKKMDKEFEHGFFVALEKTLHTIDLTRGD